jgi:hypothetical protein
VGHSYGGAVITEAGNEPQVRGLVYVAAFQPDNGETLGGLLKQKPPASIHSRPVFLIGGGVLSAVGPGRCSRALATDAACLMAPSRLKE